MVRITVPEHAGFDVINIKIVDDRTIEMLTKNGGKSFVV